MAKKEMAKKNILYVSSTPELAGANIVLMEIIKNLDRRKYHHLVLCPPQKVLREAPFYEVGVEVRYMKLGVLKRSLNPFKAIRFFVDSFSATIRLMRLIREDKIDLVHTNSSTVLSSLIAARLMKVPSIYHIHEIVSPKIVRYLLNAFAFNLIDKAVVASGPIRESLPAFKRNKITIVHNGIDMNKFDPNICGGGIRQEFGVDCRSPFIGVIGRLTPVKGQEYFIKACNEVSKEFPQARFIIVGQRFRELDFYIKKLRRMISSYDLDEKISFAFWRTDIPEIIASLDMLVQPSIRPEGFGLTIAEAMAVGKPVIATGGGPTDLITPDVGIIIKPKDPVALAKAIAYLIRNKEKAEKMGDHGRRRVEEKFNSPLAAEKINHIYQELLAGKNGGKNSASASLKEAS